MHTIAVQVKHLCRLISGKAPEDSAAVRQQEKELNPFPTSWLSNDVSSKSYKGALPKAPFVLDKKNLQEADRRALEVVVPAGDPCGIFSKLSKLNSHELKEVKK